MIEYRQNGLPYPESSPAASGIVTPLLLIVYLVAKPFYLFPSGGAQLADFVVVALILSMFLGRQAITRATGPFLWSCLLFSTYTLIVNGIWALLLNDLSMLMTPMYYFFNTAIVYIFLNCYGRIGDLLLRIGMAGIVTSIGVQLILSVWMIDPGAERNTLFFNNANQLGYWSLLCASIFFVLARYLKVRFLFQLPVLFAVLYLVALALSKSALIAMMLLLAIHFSRNIGQFFLITTIGVFAIFFVGEFLLVEQVIDRLMNIGKQSDDSLHGRGYDRIWLYPQYLLFGAGEMGLARFDETDIELHSTLGTVIFSYGVVGSFLFCLMLWRILALAGWREILYLVPAFVHGLAHQGLRFSLLWVLFAIIASVGASLASRDADASQLARGDERLPGKYPRLVATKHSN